LWLDHASGGAPGNAVVAPTQGSIVKVPVNVGDEVTLGEMAELLKTMNMQNDVVATQQGEVGKPDQPSRSLDSYMNPNKGGGR
jgi:biotin carboxyl carrier protein